MQLDSKWNETEIPDLSGRLVLVTGGNSGLGLETARVLLSKRATVVIGCKSQAKFEKAYSFLSSPQNLYFVSPLDLSDLESVDKFTSIFKSQYSQLDILINNAGIMNVPLSQTEAGVEMHFATNHLGHFVLTGKLLELLKHTKSARVVTVSSMAAHDVEYNISIPRSTENYHWEIAYKYSKLANLFFTLELNRRFNANGMGNIAVAAHPGYVRTRLQRYSKGWLRKLHITYTKWRFAQGVKEGAWPILRASTEAGLHGGEYFYPNTKNGLKGLPMKGSFPENARNELNAIELWDKSEEWSKFNFNLVR
jgi:NAD(P)-dependent dehydrogenase (short-subunit alcohol dehydrogenase family)